MARTKAKTKRGRPPKHGGYSIIATGEFPENRKYVKQYLTQVREGLVEDIGPTEEGLTTAQRVLIDRVVSKLGVVRVIEEHIRENSVMRGHDLAPCLRSSYLAYNNSVRLDLATLGINKQATEDFDPIKYIQRDAKPNETS